MAQAFRRLRRPPGLLKRRKQYRDQHRDDRHHDQELY
jgi:hypothetical protein